MNDAIKNGREKKKCSRRRTRRRRREKRRILLVENMIHISYSNSSYSIIYNSSYNLSIYIYAYTHINMYIYINICIYIFIYTHTITLIVISRSMFFFPRDILLPLLFTSSSPSYRIPDGDYTLLFLTRELNCAAFNFFFFMLYHSKKFNQFAFLLASLSL